MSETTHRRVEEIRAEYTQIYTENIKREGADKLLDYLTNKSDFFTAPALFSSLQ